MLLLVNR